MTLEQIDEELADWKTRLQSAGDNLLALTQMSTYQRLRGEGGWPTPRLTGTTAAQVGPALDGMNGLWSHYASLTGVIQRAVDLRKSISWLMPSPRALAEIEELLHGPSVELSAVELPLEKRGLLTAGEVVPKRTPAQLLKEMTDAFQQVKDLVIAVDKAWERLLPLLESYDQDAAELERRAGAAGEANHAELPWVRQRIAALRTQVEGDPLGGNTECAMVASALEQVRSRLGKLARERDQIKVVLAEARRRLEELEESHRAAKQAYAERRQKVEVDDATRLLQPPEDAEVAALEPWLRKLENTIEEGRWQAAGVGLDRWMGIARQYLAAEESARTANEELLAVRRDLRGLLDALRAKANACGRSEEVELAALAQEAWQLLHSRPTPLARAQQLVTEYESRLL
jgi:hypothetical protein